MQATNTPVVSADMEIGSKRGCMPPFPLENFQKRQKTYNIGPRKELASLPDLEHWSHSYKPRAADILLPSSLLRGVHELVYKLGDWPKPSTRFLHASLVTWLLEGRDCNDFLKLSLQPSRPYYTTFCNWVQKIDSIAMGTTTIPSWVRVNPCLYLTLYSKWYFYTHKTPTFRLKRRTVFHATSPLKGFLHHKACEE